MEWENLESQYLVDNEFLKVRQDKVKLPTSNMAFRRTLSDLIRLYADEIADMDVDICQYDKRYDVWGCFYHGKLDKDKIPEWALRHEVKDAYESKENHSYTIYLQPLE